MGTRSPSTTRSPTQPRRGLNMAPIPTATRPGAPPAAPRADAAEARHEYGLDLSAEALGGTYDLVVVAVPHEAYAALPDDQLAGMLAQGGLLADLKNLYARRPPPGVAACA